MWELSASCEYVETFCQVVGRVFLSGKQPLICGAAYPYNTIRITNEWGAVLRVISGYICIILLNMYGTYFSILNNNISLCEYVRSMHNQITLISRHYTVKNHCSSVVLIS
jgi:hypothetical protein